VSDGAASGDPDHAVDYTEIDELARFVLEESYLLSVEHDRDRGTVALTMDLVFARDHPELRPARAGEWAYYRTGVIRFLGVTEFVWTERSAPSSEPDGSASWDGFDRFVRRRASYSLEGSAGVFEIDATSLVVELTGPV
jgi:hypothetical protein